MFAAFAQINWLAVAIATVVLAALGAAYFMLLVPTQYARALGRDAAAPAPQRTIDGVGPLLCGLATVLTSAVLVAALQITTVAEALVFGIVIGLGYLVATMFNIAINPNFPHPIRYALLNAPYFLAGSVITSLLLVLI